MIVTLLFGGLSYVSGVISGVYMSEHKMLTMEDVRASFDKIVACAPKIRKSATNLASSET